MKSLDLTRLRPYGDHVDDGGIQLSFTLPVKAGEEAREAARLYAEKIGLEKAQVTWMEGMGEGFTFFVVYGFSQITIDFTEIKVPKLEMTILSHKEIESLAKETLARPLVVVGGTTGSDAHTVGIDAILSMKGLAGDKGLESYSCFAVHNLRAQVDNRLLVQKSSDLKADAILVSQVVTQQDQHLHNLKELVKLLEESRSPALRIVGGPRMSHKIAREINFDAGFGPGTKPAEVASFIVQEMIRRRKDGREKTPKGGSPKGTQGVESDAHGSSSKKRRSLFGWTRRGGEDS